MHEVKNQVATLEIYISFKLKRAMVMLTELNEGRILGKDNRLRKKANGTLKSILGKVSSESVLHTHATAKAAIYV